MEPASALMTVRIVGGTAAVCAGLGAVATLATVSNVLRGKAGDIAESAPLFRKMFFLFSGISVAFNILLALIAAALLMGFPISWWQFAAVFLPQVLYIFSLGIFWRHPRLGMSIAAASGCGNVGLTVPFLCLLPIWGPIALWLAV
jgi:hypothetical protein